MHITLFAYYWGKQKGFVNELSEVYNDIVSLLPVLISIPNVRELQLLYSPVHITLASVCVFPVVAVLPYSAEKGSLLYSTSTNRSISYNFKLNFIRKISYLFTSNWSCSCKVLKTNDLYHCTFRRYRPFCFMKKWCKIFLNLNYSFH